MKNRGVLIVYGILIVLIVIVIIQRVDFADLNDRMHPNTTFTKEVIEKNGDKEVSSLLLTNVSEKNVPVIDNKEDINQILNSLAPIDLKRVNKFSDTPKETYSIVISVQGEKTYVVTLFDKKDMMISNLKKGSVHRYLIKNDVNLDTINKYFNDVK